MKMKKNYTLLSALVLVGSMAFAQNVSNKFINEAAELKPIEGDVPGKGNFANMKAPGDTIYYEDFGTGGPGGANLPAGWTTQNNAGNSNNWIWSTVAPGGQYSGNTLALNSTTGTNGYMSLPGDLYNTPGPFVAMDASFTSPAISITPPRAAVILEFQQSQRYCCSGADELVVEVSTDGINWSTPYDATVGRNPNTATPNAELVRMNVSADLAFQSTAYVRFRQTGASHYYWMVDDVTLLEGNANNMQLEDFSVNFTDTFQYNPLHTMVPQSVMTPLSFDGATFNAGGNTQTNVVLRAQVFQDSTLAGAPGFGLTWEDSTVISPSVPSLQRDTERVATYVNTFPGYFRGVVRVTSDSVNQDPASAVGTYQFAVTDSVLARDRGEDVFVGDAGPANYVGGGNDGDRWGVMFSVANGGDTITSIEIYIANSTANDGVQIVPKVWSFEDDSATLGGAMSVTVAEALVPVTIDTSMFGTWQKFDFAIGTGPQYLAPGQYVMGWEQISGATSGLEFTAGRDRTMEPFAPAVTNFVYVNDANPGWGWVTQVAAVRAIFGNSVATGIEKEAQSQVGFEVAPNPNNGQFNVVINNDVETDYTLNVRNMLGQTVFTDLLSVNKQRTMQLDLSDYEKGVYFVSLENDDERLVKKVVVK